MEGRIKILEIYPKSEEIISFYPHIFIHLQTIMVNKRYVKQNCHVLVTTFYNPKACLTTHIMEEKLKILGTTRNLKKLYTFLSHFVHFEDFYCDVVLRLEETFVGVCWSVLKHRVPESIRFCIGDLPMYIFLILTRPYILLIVSALIFVGYKVSEILLPN